VAPAGGPWPFELRQPPTAFELPMVYLHPPEYALDSRQATSTGVDASRQKRSHAFPKQSRFGSDDEPMPRGSRKTGSVAIDGTSGSVGFTGHPRKQFGQLGYIGDGYKVVFAPKLTESRQPKRVASAGRVGPGSYEHSNALMIRTLSTAQSQPGWTICAAPRDGAPAVQPRRPASAAPVANLPSVSDPSQLKSRVPSGFGKQVCAALPTRAAWSFGCDDSRGAGQFTLAISARPQRQHPGATGPGPGHYNHEAFYGSEKLSRSPSAPAFSMPQQDRECEPMAKSSSTAGLQLHQASPISSRQPSRPASSCPRQGSASRVASSSCLSAAPTRPASSEPANASAPQRAAVPSRAMFQRDREPDDHWDHGTSEAN